MGMYISVEKSCIYFHNVPEGVLSELKSYFQYKFAKSDDGFIYPRFVLKPNKYRVVEWMWLVKNIERITSN